MSEAGQIAWQLEYLIFNRDTLMRRSFAKHLQQVAACLRAIGKNDDGDGAPDEDALIRACLHGDAELKQAKEELQAAIETAKRLL